MATEQYEVNSISLRASTFHSQSWIFFDSPGLERIYKDYYYYDFFCHLIDCWGWNENNITHRSSRRGAWLGIIFRMGDKIMYILKKSDVG